MMQDLLQGQELPPGIDPPMPMSVTFIPATVSDNPALLRANPQYLAWLLSLPTLERERLLAGNCQKEVLGSPGHSAAAGNERSRSRRQPNRCDHGD
jgi:hypothetical protein